MPRAIGFDDDLERQHLVARTDQANDRPSHAELRALAG